jgi:hypothetical protein
MLSVLLFYDAQVDPEVLFKVFRMIDAQKGNPKTVESLFKLVVAIITKCTIDLNHQGFIEARALPLVGVIRFWKPSVLLKRFETYVS